MPPDRLGFGTAIYSCPLPECLWTLREEMTAHVAFRIDQATVATAMIPGPYQDVARGRVEAAISQASLEQAETLENEIRVHLESHDVLDFVRAIRLLEQQVYQQDSGIRPHSRRVPRDPSHDPDWNGYGEWYR